MNCKKQRIEIQLPLSLSPSLGGKLWSLVGFSFREEGACRADNHAHVVTPKAPCFISISPCLPPAPELLEIAFGTCAGVCVCVCLSACACVRMPMPAWCMFLFSYKNNRDFRDFNQSERSCFILSDGLQRKRENRNPKIQRCKEIDKHEV